MDYIFYFKKMEFPSDDDLQAIRNHNNLDIIDHEVDRLLLVRSDNHSIEDLKTLFENWHVSEVGWYEKPKDET